MFGGSSNTEYDGRKVTSRDTHGFPLFSVVDVGTGSGDVRVIDGDLEEFLAGTGSGTVRLENRGSRLARVKADTGSGDVVLRLAPEATFEALADQGRGDMVVRYKDAPPIRRHKEVIGY